MTTIIRRYRRRLTAAAAMPWAAAGLLAAALGVLVAVIWMKGGPQPVHQIVIALPAPVIEHTGGRRA